MSKNAKNMTKKSEPQLDVAGLEQQLEKSLDHVYELFLALRKICDMHVKEADALSRRPSKYSDFIQ